MKSSGVKYLFKEGLRNVWSNRLMSLASIGVLSACLLLVGVTVLLTANVDSMIGYVEEQNDVVIFLKDDATPEQTEEMQQGLEQLDGVTNVTYISKEQALEDYVKSLNDEALVEGIGDDNFLPASFRVSTDDLNNINVIIDKAMTYPIYDSSNAPTGAADTIISLKNTVAIFGSVIILALVIVSLVVISNTIRATVFTRRTEIGIMKQVGATNNFIRIPFLVEGMTLGFISAVLSFVATWIGYAIINDILMNNASDFLRSMYESIIPFSHIGWILGLCFFFAGICTGALGSVLSLRKHLKV